MKLFLLFLLFWYRVFSNSLIIRYKNVQIKTFKGIIVWSEKGIKTHPHFGLWVQTNKSLRVYTISYVFSTDFRRKLVKSTEIPDNHLETALYCFIESVIFYSSCLKIWYHMIILGDILGALHHCELECWTKNFLCSASQKKIHWYFLLESLMNFFLVKSKMI